MAGKPKYDWDSITDDMIRKAYGATRSYTLAGQALGLERGGALREHLRDVRPKLKAELDAMGVKLKAVPPPEAVPVDDPLRIKTVQQDALISQLRSEIKQYDKALATQEEFFARVVEQSRVPVTVPKFKMSRPSAMGCRASLRSSRSTTASTASTSRWPTSSAYAVSSPRRSSTTASSGGRRP